MGTKFLAKVNCFKKEFFNASLNLLWPPLCLTCGAAIKLPYEFGLGNFYCEKCLNKIDFIKGDLCNICGRPYWGEAKNICSDCLNYKPIFHKAKAAVLYTDIISKSILSFKYKLKFYQIKALACIYKDVLSSSEIDYFDFIIPIPLSRKKFLTRGFNQSYELAKEIFKKSNHKIKNDVLLKVKDSDFSQASLNAKDRQIQILNTFEVNKKIELNGLKIMIFDDILTTGATANEAARVILKSGASVVELRTIARTVPKRWLNN